MSYDEQVTPVNHSAGSAFGAKAAGTLGGAAKGGIGAALLWTAAAAVVGAVIAVSIFTGTFPALAGSTGLLTGLGHVLTSGVTWGIIVGGGLGAALGLGSSWLPGGIGAIVGGAKGHAKASGRVEQERSAAMQQQAEISMVRAQMAEPTQQVNVGFPVQGSRFNQAESSISADSISNDGRMGGLQLQRA